MTIHPGTAPLVLLTTLLTVAGVAHAVERNDIQYPAARDYPGNARPICLGGECGVGGAEAGNIAAQSFDCNQAGLGLPVGGRGLAIPSSRPMQYLVLPDDNFGLDAWPGAGQFGDIGASSGPKKYSTGADGQIPADIPVAVHRAGGPAPVDSIIIEMSLGARRPDVRPLELVQEFSLDGSTYVTAMGPPADIGYLRIQMTLAGATNIFDNSCRMVLQPTDPHFLRTGRNDGNSWGARLDDQWAIKRVGLSNDRYSAWQAVPADAEPVVVAVIDTGLDWHHRDISADNIWRNPAEYPDNGIDDDGNGYVDDIIGWDFLAGNNKPWDHDGHGTIVSGIIAATQNNDIGIAGINPHVKIMVLKAVNNFGTTRASFLAEAIVYAVDNGAQLINISVGGSRANSVEQAAIRYARNAGVLVIAAAGNDGAELDDFGPGGNDGVLTVGATHVDDRAAAFSNYGDKVDLVAPGVDVLSLRARYTDANFRPNGVDDGDDEYEIGSNFVGEDTRYIRASGTSFSTPIVTGVASLLLARDPQMPTSDVERLLKLTAADVDAAGNDPYTGFGMVDARAALGVDADFFIRADITGLQAMPAEAPQLIQVVGTVDASEFKRAWLQIGPGENPSAWRYVGAKLKFPIIDGALASIPLSQFAGNDLWQVMVNVEHKNGVTRRDLFPIRIK